MVPVQLGSTLFAFFDFPSDKSYRSLEPGPFFSINSVEALRKPKQYKKVMQKLLSDIIQALKSYSIAAFSLF